MRETTKKVCGNLKFYIKFPISNQKQHWRENLKKTKKLFSFDENENLYNNSRN